MRLITKLYSSLVLALACSFHPAIAAEYAIAETIDIDTVPSWFRVGFCLLTDRDHQYAAYYNETHQMVVAHRRLDQREWDKFALPSKISWDSHNYITMVIDRDEETLQVVDRKVTIQPEYPPGMRKPTSTFAGMGVQLQRDIGERLDPQVRYVLRWETLGSNHDKPRDPPLPPTSMLQLIKLVKTSKSAVQSPEP